MTMNLNTWSEGYPLKDRDTSVIDVSEDADLGRQTIAVIPNHTARRYGSPYEVSRRASEYIAQCPRWEQSSRTVACALIATVLQAIELVWPGILAYSSFAHRCKLTGLKPSIGFPLQAAGTVLLTLSLVLCAGIINNGSCERHWMREGESKQRCATLLDSEAAPFR